MNSQFESLASKTPAAVLVLEDGSTFHGRAIGALGETVGEVVFNTAITGYQEILTDPSYAKQIVTLTYSHIGNVGINSEDAESENIHAAGLVIKDLPEIYSNWRSKESLAAYLKKENIVAIADIDTRRLTRLLRDKGALKGAIVAAEKISDAEINSALDNAKAFAGLKGLDLAKEVTTSARYAWSETVWQGPDEEPVETIKPAFKVVAYDFGVKRNILRMLAARGCDISVVPAKTPAAEVLAMQADGIFLSNGPGDPEPCDYAISAIQEFIRKQIPIFGICLGHQLLSLAAGAKTMKMKFGHHGANHPVQDLASGKVMITSQNHGFAVDESSLPAHIKATHRSLFDQSLQGIELTNAPAFGFQGHPEASPGPHDVAPLFDKFIESMRA